MEPHKFTPWKPLNRHGILRPVLVRSASSRQGLMSIKKDLEWPRQTHPIQGKIPLDTVGSVPDV